MAVCAAVTVGYLVYRGMYTLNLDGWYASTASWLLYVAEIWGGTSLLLFFMQVRNATWSRAVKDRDVQHCGRDE